MHAPAAFQKVLGLGTSRLEIRGRQERALLALLLTAPGRVFSIGEIVAGPVGDRPPGGAETRVMSDVSRLRRGISDGVATMVVTCRPVTSSRSRRTRSTLSAFAPWSGEVTVNSMPGRPALGAERLREAVARRGDWWLAPTVGAPRFIASTASRASRAGFP